MTRGPRTPMPARLREALGRAATPVITAAAVASVIGAVLTFVIAPLAGTFTGAFEDFAAYSGASHLMAAGASPYAAFTGDTVVMSGFDYPPFAAVLVKPLALMSAHWQVITWLWLSLAALVAAAVITARALLPAAWPRTRIAVLVALTFPAATYNLWHGQINTLIFLALALALTSYLSGHHTRCAVILGIAASIKLAPIVLLVVLARRGSWRAVLAGVATVAATALTSVAVLGWPIARQYLDSVLPVLDRDNGWIYNQTWNGVVNRLAGHAVLAPGTASAPLHDLVLVLSLATVAALWLAVSPAQRTRAERGAEFACGVVAMLLVGSIAWYPVYVHILIALAAAVGLAVERGLMRNALTAWIGACFGAVTVAGGLLITVASMPAVVQVSHGPLWWVFLQLCSLPALVAAGLLVALARELRAPAVSRVAAPAT